WRVIFRIRRSRRKRPQADMSALARHSEATLEAALPRAIEWRDGELYLLDQTRLPAEAVMERQDNARAVFDSIRQLKVRGAPAIGVAAAYGLCVALKPYRDSGIEEFLQQIDLQAAFLDSARPTAVNLGWALRRMQAFAARCQ